MFDKNYTIVRMLLETIEKIFRYTNDLGSAEEFENDVESFDASVMNLIVLDEGVAKLSEEFKSKNDQVKWHKIYAFRNVIAHC